MLRARLCTTHMDGFLGQYSLNKGPFFGRFFLDMDRFSRNWQRLVKNGHFSAKINHKSGYDGNRR